MTDTKIELDSENLEEVSGGCAPPPDQIAEDIVEIGEPVAIPAKKKAAPVQPTPKPSSGGQTNTINGAGGKQQNNQNVNYSGKVNNSF